MSFKILRVAKGKNSTLSQLYRNDIFLSYLLEDAISPVKIPGKTCIPEGKYQLKLNTAAKMNIRYKSSFPDMHKGMIEIAGISNFTGVFIHIGNYHSDTAGCPLTGHYWNLVKGDYQVLQSTFAYQQVYPQLLSEISKGNTALRVINMI